MFGWRRGIIYAYSTLDPKSGKREKWAYIGKTRQPLSKRHEQHLTSQPWSDLYPQVRVVFDFTSCPDWWLTLFEKYTIRFARPTYNYEYNTKNPHRVPLYRAQADRKTRDRLARMRRPW